MLQWIIPCNIHSYDIVGAFRKLKCIDWKQSNHSIAVGDEVFIYVGRPVSAIMYRCKVNRVNVPHITIDDSEYVLNGTTYESYGNYMELELIEEFERTRFSIEILQANGLKGNIQGPRRVKELETILNTYLREDEIEKTNLEKVLNGKEREILTKVRVNQGVFRENLLQRYKSCCLCGVKDTRFLVASHIKPWSQCEAKEKTDVNKPMTTDDVYVVWYSKSLKNHKALLSTTVCDGMHYELTYNGEKDELYMDAYKKWENICIENVKQKI